MYTHFAVLLVYSIIITTNYTDFHSLFTHRNCKVTLLNHDLVYLKIIENKLLIIKQI